MLEFSKYPSLENHYREKFIENIRMNVPSDAIWIAHEKMHGANLSLWTDGVEVKIAKRSGWIEEGEKLYGLNQIREELEQKVLGAYRNVDRSPWTKVGEGGVLTVWGELVGRGVQKGVNYVDDQAFFMFDVSWDGELIHEDSILARTVGMSFDHTPFVGCGTLDEMLALENDFDSKIQAGSEAFTAEGLVIKPVSKDYLFLPSGHRAAIKSKNDKFSENSGKAKVKQDTPLPPEVGQWVDAVSPYINENRVDAVLSKLGEFDMSMFGKVLNMVVLDAIEDYEKDSEKDMMLLDKVVRKRVQGALIPLVKPLLFEKA